MQVVSEAEAQKLQQAQQEWQEQLQEQERYVVEALQKRCRGVSFCCFAKLLQRHELLDGFGRVFAEYLQSVRRVFAKC